MPKNKKLKLNNLTVTSFVTRLESGKVKGGATWTIYKTCGDECDYSAAEVCSDVTCPTNYATCDQFTCAPSCPLSECKTCGPECTHGTPPII